MTSDSTAAVDRLFLEALQLPPGEREPFVRRACGGDASLSAEVLSLCAVAQEADGYFEQPSGLRTLFFEAVGGEASPEGLQAGTRVGVYEIVGEVGRGGIGVVYRAERADGLFAQSVALKVLKRGMDTDAVLRRFLRERAVLAGLEHPQVARLLDGGSLPSGAPYFVMELVEGDPITDYAEAHDLSVEARVALVQDVCAAVAYAHRNLVVHRDLKPANILVAEGGQVKLLDFGVARLLCGDGTSPIETGEGPRPLTPAYAAPEQFTDAPTTTATDVYALGVVLHEVLTGQRPRRGGPTDPTLPSPPRPRGEHRDEGERAGPSLLPDLAAVCRKALREEPEDRYASVDALAEDLGRWRAGLPVLARRGSRRYVVGKFVQRHRRAVGVVALSAAALVVAGAMLVRAERVATVERDLADAAREEAAASAAFLTDLLLSIDPASGRGAQSTVRDLLDGGAARIDQLDAQPRVQAPILDVFARVYRSLGLLDNAAPLHQRAVATAQAAFGPDAPETLAAKHHYAYLLDQQGRNTEAAALYRSVLAVRQQTGDPDGTVESISDYAALLVKTGQLDEAASLVYDGLAVLDEHPEAGPAGFEGPLSRAGLLYTLGGIARERGDYVEAVRQMQGALDGYRAEMGPDHVYVALIETGLAGVQIRQRRFDEAQRLLVHARGVFMEQAGEDHPWTALADRRLAEVAASAP